VESCLCRLRDGHDAFGGDSTFTEDTLSQTGTGATNLYPADTKKSRGETGTADQQDKTEREAEQAMLEKLAETLTARGGESMTMQSLLRHVVTRVTDEGLVIEIFDTPGQPLFRPETDEPARETREIAALLVEVLSLTLNRVAVEGHVHAYPVTLAQNPTWDLSARRAQAFRALLEDKGFDAARIVRITGHADRKPAVADPAAQRNNRIEVILLRKNT
jgi:chemotaxis protein MotB